MRGHPRLILALFALGLSAPALADDPPPVELPPCGDDCKIDPCELNPSKPGCSDQPGPIEAPDPPVEDPIAPVEPPPPDKPETPETPEKPDQSH